MSRIATSIPSPDHGVWHLGPFPIRAYALCILAGIFVAVWWGNKRFIARGGLDGQVAEVAIIAVPMGVLGGRLYHVITDWSAYFGTGGKGFLGALRVWEGGLGIWGALALGGVGAYIGCRREGIPLSTFGDAVAPGIAVAQAMGRWGNYFNQELFGRPTTLPWALEIDPQYRPAGYEQYSTFHPTFLYESLACLAIAAVVMWADKRFTMGHGRVFALYLALYCAARGAIETLRIDEAHHIAGIRLNVFTALIVGSCALVYLVRSLERNPGREVLDLKPKSQGVVSRTPSRRRAAIATESEVNEAPVLDSKAEVLVESASAQEPVATVPAASDDAPKAPRIRRIKQD